MCADKMITLTLGSTALVDAFLQSANGTARIQPINNVYQVDPNARRANQDNWPFLVTPFTPLSGDRLDELGGISELGGQ